VVGKLIEETEPFFRPGSDRVYHALTKDFITNEIFRRVEPSGRTMGEYWQQEIQKKLGVDVYLKMDEADLVKCFNFTWLGMWRCYKNSKLPFDQGRYMTFTLGEMSGFGEMEKKQ
jgi:CubicO group peptidase (beta-lactamase class C family)